MIKPWLPFTLEQKQQIKQLADRLQINYKTNWFDTNYYNLVSYTFRSARNNLTSYLRGNYYNYYNENTEETRTDGQVESIMLTLLASLHNEIKEMIRGVFYTRDRAGQDRNDVLPLERITGTGYFPKGITDFKPDNKKLDADLSARIQREIIKENGADPELVNSPDLTITVKVFAEPGQYLHTYFNKKSEQTIRRVYYKTIQANLQFFNMKDLITDEQDKALFDIICNNFFTPNEKSVPNVIEFLTSYINEKLKYQEENLVKIFATEKQTAMNQERKRTLEQNLKYAEQSYNDNMARYSSLRNEYLQARKAVDTFEEVKFEAVEVFLNKIKDYPRTKQFAKINVTCLQFLIEEPLIHTESETWAKYLTNVNSSINEKINAYAVSNYTDFNTTVDIIRYAVQRFFKETLVDQKIRLYTTALLGIRSDRTNFEIEKFSFNGYEYFPHPHIGTAGLTCWGEATRQISKNILENDGEMAFLQLNYALQQMTASDTVVAKKLTDLILNYNYGTHPYYLRKGKTERESFETILKEFIADETNKINAIIDSES